MQTFDFRSDTVTRPDEGMRAAIAAAEVGDDVFGDDPTILHLQERVAGLLGKEAGLYVPSGTMSNQLALRAATSPGDQIVCEADGHIYRYESGAPALLSGLLVTCVPSADGVMEWSDIEARLNPSDNYHCAPPSLVCLENSHNCAGGRILPQDGVVDISERAHERGLRVHLDGARLWHVHAATSTPLAELAAPADSVSVCFSKGLGAPVGSMLCAEAEFIERARRFRKVFGGAMRQAGILAAACLYALDHNLDRLAEDHDKATRLAAGLDNPALSIDHPVDSNIVIIDVGPVDRDEALLAHLADRGVAAIGFGRGRIRFVTHLDVPAGAVDVAIDALNAFKG